MTGECSGSPSRGRLRKRWIDTVIEWSPFAGHQICGRSNIVVMANSPIRSEGENIYIIIGVMRMPLIKETWLRG